jgi:nicotinate phosphoribosyltransferase
MRSEFCDSISTLRDLESNLIKKSIILCITRSCCSMPYDLHCFSLSKGHSIDTFGIGTHLVTCQKQPALGCVFKLVEINSRPCIKLSEEFEKITFPGKKNAYRIFDKDNNALVDFLTKGDEPAPKVGETFLCRHPFMESKRAYLTASRIDELLVPYWQDGHVVRENLQTIEQIKQRVTEQLKCLRSDHKRVLNPTPYKVGSRLFAC